MALVSFVPAQRVGIPHEPGEWMEFRKPRNQDVRSARKAVEREGRQGFGDFGAEVIRVMTDVRNNQDEDAAIARIKRLSREQEYDPAQFDRDILLQSAIKGWSYQAPVSAENIADLDEATARWAHGYVVDLMKPPTQEAEKSTPQATASGA